MSIKIKSKRIVKVDQAVYELIVYIKNRHIPLGGLKPGGITFNYNTENKIRSHVFSISPQPNQIILIREGGPRNLAKDVNNGNIS